MIFVAMKGYRVVFEDNIPVFARQIDTFDDKEMVRITTSGTKKVLHWLIVYGDSERDAIEIASKVMQTIWAEYLT